MLSGASNYEELWVIRFKVFTNRIFYNITRWLPNFEKNYSYHLAIIRNNSILPVISFYG